MVKKILDFFLKIMQKYLPAPLTIAWLITLFVSVMALIFTPTTPLKLVQYWGGGIWNLLTFAMQMTLMLVSGYALAASKPVHNLLKRLVRIPKTPKQTILFIAFISMFLYYFNWGLGLIAGGMLAREAALYHKDTDFRLIVTAAFSGIIITHGGLSASVPLLINTPGHFAEKQIGLVPLTQTIFAPQCLFIIIGLVVIIPFACLLMMPKKGTEVIADPALFADAEDEIAETVVDKKSLSLGERLDRSKILNITFWLMGLTYLISYFIKNGFNININTIVLTFIVAGLICHGSLTKYMDAFGKGCSTASGIIFQFPIYAGIMGIMEGSGLVLMISHWLLSTATPKTFELWCYFSSLIITCFVPSAGGHWAVQAPFMLPAAKALGVPAWKVAMGVAWGESIWNIICPMWALPLLAIAKIDLRDLMAFSVLLFIIGNIITIAGILIFH
ncbi:short-chain fatty acid transporter [Clostridium thailandense]|uniref:short-chain fatty acid transporter n=1 Tax=Clostridium thailandense TaxID=2794346 RepID=UPI003988BC89